MTGETPEIPAHGELLWTTLCAVRELGHSARLDEIDERVIERENFSEAQLAVLHNDGPRSEIEYRLAWARTYLKGMGALTNASRGIWETTGVGRELSAEEIEPLWREHQAARRADKRREADAVDADVEPDGDGAAPDHWKEQLLQHMIAMSPAGFERLAQRLLRAAGFTNSTVTGRSGDGGIDGVGAYRLSLVSFPVFFQCLLITTGVFTPGARAEATRDGAPPIDLIDGEQLCELLKEHQLGVRITERVVEDIEVVGSFFNDLG